MLGDILRVEQAIAAGAQPRDQMHQRDFRGVARAMKHTLAEKRAAERDAVKSADQLVAVIDFDAVAMAVVIQAAVALAEAGMEPGAVGLGGCVVLVQGGRTQLRPVAAPEEPRDARTPEWPRSSPPPEYTFAEVPIVTNRDEFWHRKYTEDAEGRLVKLPAGAAEPPGGRTQGPAFPPRE